MKAIVRLSIFVPFICSVAFGAMYYVMPLQAAELAWEEKEEAAREAASSGDQGPAVMLAFTSKERFLARQMGATQEFRRNIAIIALSLGAFISFLMWFAAMLMQAGPSKGRTPE